MNIYLNDWEESELEGLKSDFSIDSHDLEGMEIIFASYTYEDYSGSAFVLFRKDGKLFEVNGSHCSCYGLEGQWEPSEVFYKELISRVETSYEFNGCRDELREALIKLNQ